MIDIFDQEIKEILKEKSNEWYTPARYIEAARQVMGEITLDPASCAQANKTVKAHNFYTEAQNGLVLPWYGNVWLNPPYSHKKSPLGMSKGASRKGPTHLFVSRLVQEYVMGNIAQAIVCVNADTVRPWFQLLWDYTICFCNRPVDFVLPTGERRHHFFPTAFAYLGNNEQRFYEVFSRFGTIAIRAYTPPAEDKIIGLWGSI